jgi:hypothetical protein
MQIYLNNDHDDELRMICYASNYWGHRIVTKEIVPGKHLIDSVQKKKIVILGTTYIICKMLQTET